MRFLQFKLYQETAVYRNHLTMENMETYPLPPFSTVLGFLHNLIEADTTIPDMKISIQGSYSSLMRDYQWYKKIKKTGIENYPIVVNTLNEVQLVLHIQAEEKIMDDFYHTLMSPPRFMYLGRAEDIVKIEEVKYVNAEKKELESIIMPAYIPEALANSIDVQGILYSLPYYYKFRDISIGNENRKIRDFNWLNYFYVESGDIESDETILIDEDNLPIWV